MAFPQPAAGYISPAPPAAVHPPPWSLGIVNLLLYHVKSASPLKSRSPLPPPLIRLLPLPPSPPTRASSFFVLGAQWVGIKCAGSLADAAAGALRRWRTFVRSPEERQADCIGCSSFFFFVVVAGAVDGIGHALVDSLG